MDNNKWDCFFSLSLSLFCTCYSMKATERKGLPPQRHHWFRRRWRHRSSLGQCLCGDVSVSVLMRLWLLLLLGTFSSAQLGAFRRRKLQFLSLSPATNSWDFVFMTLMKRLNYRPMRTTSYKWGKFNFPLFGWCLKAGLFGLWLWLRELFLSLL